MSNELSEMFKSSLVNFINNEEEFSEYDSERAVEVTDFEEYEYSTGFCESCYYGETRVRVDYVNALGEDVKFYHFGDFANLVRELIRL